MRKLVLLASLSLACGGDDDGGPTDPGDGGGNGTFTVSVTNNAFNPGSLSVPAGSTVTWQWNSAGVAHNVTWEDGHPASASQSSGTYARTFSSTGDYNYQCTIHPGMVAQVSVTTSATGGGGTGGGGTGGGGTGGGGYP